jgi:predicted nuclease of predicted toxin-antitoxin system
MEFKVDESLPVEAADLLRHVGYDAITVLEERLGGASDPDIGSVCQDEERVLITLDTDFADIRVYPRQYSPA